VQGTHQIAVGARHQPVAQLHDRHRGSQTVVDTGHFETDDSAADHQQALAVLGQLQRTGRVDDARIVRKAGQPHRLGSGRDDALLEVDALHAVGGLELEGMRADEFRLAAQHVHLALPGEHVEPVGEPRYHPILPAAQLLALDPGRRKHDAARFHCRRILDHLGRVQQRLGGNAPDVETHAAEHRPALDKGHLEP
jgi:hypothetical protein